MLVLSRQRDESIMIGDKVVVTIVDIRGDKVRLGIEAPEEIPVHRQEVYDAIRRENQRAGQVDAGEVQPLGRGKAQAMIRSPPFGESLPMIPKVRGAYLREWAAFTKFFSFAGKKRADTRN